jgi:hypothetical protein
MSNHKSTNYLKFSQRSKKIMFKNKKFSLITIGTLVVTLALGLVAFSPVHLASATTPEGDGYYHGRGFGDSRSGTKFDDDTYLAEALGISADELQVARENAQSAAVEQALEEGLITQAQADRLIESSFRNFKLLVGSGSSIDMDVLLADALSISVEELQDAREAAKTAAIEQAVADGRITEEQAALMEARQALNDYIEKDDLLAKALGISVEELQATQEGGQHLPDLLEELGIDTEDFRSAMQAAHEEILQQAVDESVITQEQADLLLENGFHNLHGPGGRHGRSHGNQEGFERPDGFPSRSGNNGADETDSQIPAEPTYEG